MDNQKAITILVQAVNVAQSRGIFTLPEAKLVAEAVDLFMPKEDKPEKILEKQEETDK